MNPDTHPAQLEGHIHALGLLAFLWAQSRPEELGVLSEHQGGEEVSCLTSASPPPRAFLGGGPSPLWGLGNLAFP